MELEGKVLTEEEDRELEQQLKRLNEPAVKTIQTEHGDIYDCVDFYKQPAFDHPLLKNHSFHLGIGLQFALTTMLQKLRLFEPSSLLERSIVSVEMPHANTSQYSSARMETRNGLDSIQVWWMANPTLYGDNRTRGLIGLKISTQARQPSSGFTSPRLDEPKACETQAGFASPTRTQRGARETWVKDKFSENWWLELGLTHTQAEFWPQQTFTGLKDLAN
ncbi:uncharacterized protein LOC116203390 [Punica granatum]|uniref:Uncharacterized protein LOC116203390 n=1 Tax=Punica granatum TaxID=22663 RepID=A0A6P8DBS8_PUNGR|nr:uncharacterized protein LOC116203390 [Punica granatum]